MWASPAQKLARRHIRIVPAPLAPDQKACTKRPISGSKQGIHHKETGNAVRGFHRQRQAQHATPSPALPGSARQVSTDPETPAACCDENQKCKRLFPGLIRTTEAEEVRHNDSRPRRQEYRNHSTEKKAQVGSPCRHRNVSSASSGPTSR